MGTSLFWKKKGKAALTSLLFLYLFNSFAQTSTSQSITYTCRSARFETVMNVLSRQTGYDFVYSSSIIDVSKPISLSVRNKSINEVLMLIEPQADVFFKVHDRHIVVKGNPKPAPIAMPANDRHLAMMHPAFTTNDSLLLTSTRKTLPVRIFESQASQLEDHLNKRITELQQLIGANLPHSIPNRYVKAINFNNRYNGWYASIGTYVGDHASGLEFQGGLKYAYGVFVPRWSADHGFYGAYGVGNTLQLRGPFSINTMYVYSGYRDSQVIHHYRMGIPDGPDTRHTEIVRHHQVKLGLRYSFNENLSLRAGPVLNYRSNVSTVSIIPPNNFTYGSIEHRPGYENPGNVSNTQFYANTVRSVDKWIGWDISLQYRINFYKKGF